MQSNELSKSSPDEDPIHVGRLEQNTQQGYNHWDRTPKRAGTRSTEIWIALSCNIWNQEKQIRKEVENDSRKLLQWP